MKKVLVVLLAIALVMSFCGTALAKKTEGTSIQDGVLVYTSGYLEDETIDVGYNIFGYNYQARMFKGSYANAYLGRYDFGPYNGDDEAYLEEFPNAESNWVWPYRNDKLLMKWNDAWLSNMDCDDDGALDRHYGFASYIGSGAWLTNHQSGTYIDGEGVTQKWTYFCKIVAAPEDATVVDGFWIAADGTEIGPVIWGEFATVLEISTDTGTGENGVSYKAKRPALGNW